MSDNSNLSLYLDEEHLSLMFIRHGEPGEPPANHAIPDYLLGRPLTARGLKQADLLAQRLESVPIDQIYCSDMARSYQTASAISALKPDVPMEMTPDLREVAGFHSPLKDPPETDEQLEQFRREQASAERMLKRIYDEHGIGQTVVMVAHGGRDQLMYSKIFGADSKEFVPFSHFHTSVTIIGIPAEAKARFTLVNCTRHLPPHLATAVNPPRLATVQNGVST